MRSTTGERTPADLKEFEHITVEERQKLEAKRYKELSRNERMLDPVLCQRLDKAVLAKCDKEPVDLVSFQVNL